jgi:hypothetical protein
MFKSNRPLLILIKSQPAEKIQVIKNLYGDHHTKNIKQYSKGDGRYNHGAKIR